MGGDVDKTIQPWAIVFTLIIFTQSQLHVAILPSELAMTRRTRGPRLQVRGGYPSFQYTGLLDSSHSHERLCTSLGKLFLLLLQLLLIDAKTVDHMFPISPVAFQVILEPGIGQFREFDPRRVHARVNSLGLFSCAQIDFRKARERELATLDENRRAVGLLNPLRDKN